MYPYLISEGFVFFACELSLCVSGCWSSDFDCPLSLFPPLPSSYTPAVTPCSYNHVNGTLDEDEKIEPTPIIIFEVCVSEGEKEGGGERACYIMKFPCGECVYTHVTCGERVYVRSFVRVLWFTVHIFLCTWQVRILFQLFTSS
jgi:hypothetical protein